jgi:hypothetical protein
MSTRKTDMPSVFRATWSRGVVRDEQHQVRMLGAAGPDLLPVDDPFVAASRRGGADRGRVGAGGGLGDAEGLEAERAFSDAGEVALLLRRRAVPEHRPHRVHLRMARGAVAA